MALTANFSSSESIASPNLITFTDTSQGVDNTITVRRVIVRLANGNYLTAGATQSSTLAYTTWNYSDPTITINLISSSTTASVTVEWYAGSTLTYTKTILMEWDIYDYLFAFELLQSQTATPTIISDTNYYANFFMFLTNLWNSENAVTVGNDLYSSQAALNKNQNLINNSSLYF